MSDRHRDMGANEVTVTRIDLSWSNVLVLTLKFGVVWAVLGLIGAIVYSAVR